MPVDPNTVRRVRVGVLVGIVLVFGLAVGLSATGRREVERATQIIAGGDASALRDYILSFGVWAPIASTALMLFQALAAPLPAFLLAFANGLAFGPLWGVLLTMASATLAAALSFGIARSVGRPAVEALIGRAPLAQVDRFFRRWGKWAVLVARLIPIVSFDVVSYAAGLTRLRVWPFLLATVVGMAPATVAYTLLGAYTPDTLSCLLLASVVAALIVVVALVRRRRR